MEIFYHRQKMLDAKEYNAKYGKRWFWERFKLISVLSY